MTHKFKVGVVGSGIGLSHIRAYKNLPDLYEVSVICDIDQDRAREVAAEYNIPHISANLADLCAMAELDIIDICTPSYLHYTQAKQVLEAGKYAICEKPHAGSLQEIDDLIRVEGRSGKRLMPIFQYRFGHGAQRLKYLIDQGLAGAPYLTTVETAWRRRSPYYAVPWRGKWQTELGGALVTLAIHAHDLVLYLLGPVKSVFARTATLVNPIETEDTVSASLEMVNGSLVSLSVTTGSTQQISRHRFCFSQLTAESNLAPYRNTADPWSFSGDTPELTQEIETTLATFEPQLEHYEGQFYRFHQAVFGNSALPVSLADARQALELITAIYYSARTGNAVELPLDSDHPNYMSWRP